MFLRITVTSDMYLNVHLYYFKPDRLKPLRFFYSNEHASHSISSLLVLLLIFARDGPHALSPSTAGAALFATRTAATPTPCCCLTRDSLSLLPPPPPSPSMRPPSLPLLPLLPTHRRRCPSSPH
jgi:hypothetical protein